MKKIMIMAGGTGGHIFPAAAVAEQLIAQQYNVRWLGSRRGMEGQLVPKLGFEFLGLPVTAWHGGRLRKLMTPINLLRAFVGCLLFFKREKPDLVIGFGGYASAPGGMAASLLNIPLVLHEQNGVAGLTNSKLEKKASVVLQAFPNTFKENYEVVGNPVRSALCQLPKPSERRVGEARKLKVLILGGSQGAQALNEVLPDAIAMCDRSSEIDIWHQAGKNKVDQTRSAYANLKIEATVVEFIDDMAKAYHWCDLVIARSGASTVSELAAVGAYGILIPYPWHKDQQQLKNAQWLVNQSAAECINQSDLSAESLSQRISYWNVNRNKLVANSEAAWQMGIRDSAKRIVKIVQQNLVKESQ